jgi:hypothetical protein
MSHSIGLLELFNEDCQDGGYTTRGEIQAWQAMVIEVGGGGGVM